jgi:hypothetical protein
VLHVAFFFLNVLHLSVVNLRLAWPWLIKDWIELGIQVGITSVNVPALLTVQEQQTLFDSFDSGIRML